MFGWFKRKPEPRVVAAVMSAASVKHDPTRAQAIEAAMSRAVMDYLARGGSLNDSEAVRQVQLQARNRALGRN